MPLRKSYRVSAASIVAALLLVSTGPALHGLCVAGDADAHGSPCNHHAKPRPVDGMQCHDSINAPAPEQDRSVPAHHECCTVSPAVLTGFKAIQNWDSGEMTGLFVRSLFEAIGAQRADRWSDPPPVQHLFTASGTFLLNSVILR